MKILIVQQNLPPYIVDGVRMHVYDLAQGLSKKGIDVHIITEKPGIHKNILGSEGFEEFQWRNFTVHRVVPVLRKLDWPSYIALVGRCIKKLNEEHKFDIIHVHGPHAGFLLYYKPLIPSIITIHGAFISEYDALKLDSSLHEMHIVDKVRVICGARLYAMLEKIACRKVDRVIAISERERRTLIKRYGVEKSKITVIQHGINITKLRELAGKSNFVVEAERPIILFVGRLTARKGIDQLLKSWALLKKRKINGTLMIIGSGYLEALVKKYQHSVPNIIFLQNLARKDLLKVYSLADAFVLPSLFEGVPYTLLEAASFSKPLIVSNLLGIDDILGDSALYVNPLSTTDLANKLALIIKNDELRKDLSNKSENLATRFSIEKMIEKTIRVYMEALHH